MPVPLDPFGRTALPTSALRDGDAQIDRLRRLEMIALAADALLEKGDAPSLFVGGALRAWLERGGPTGSLEKEFLAVAPPHRSTLTPARLWAIASRRRQQGAHDHPNIVSSNQPESDQ